MGLFGNSDDSAHSRSLWSRLTKHKKSEQKSTANSSPASLIPEKQQRQQPLQLRPPVIRVPEDSKRDNFRLSLQSLRTRPRSNSNSQSQNRTSCLATEQLDSRLRTSKLQCEQLKKKVATISFECSKLESQCRELSDVKEQLLSFHTDITMLKRKEKVNSEIQQRIGYLEEESFSMVDQIEHIRMKLSELKTELRPEFIHKRLDQLESDGHKLTTITLQNRRDQDRFSLDVGNQLVETFVTQQTIYEEFRRLQHRLVSVERQNQIMSDLIHFHCHKSQEVAGHSVLMSNSDTSRGAVSLLASTEMASSSFSPTFSDRDAEKTNTSPSNIDWQFTDQGDSLFMCDTFNKSLETNKNSIIERNKEHNYYKIDFTSKSESPTTLQLADISSTLSGSVISTEEPINDDISTATYVISNSRGAPFSDPRASLERKEFCPTVSQHRDDGYYSTSQDGTIVTDRHMVSDIVLSQGTVTLFQDDKERYLILTRHVQKSKGRSLRWLSQSKSCYTLVIKSSMDLETLLSNRSLRQRQHRQRDSQATDEDATQVFSDTELYGTRFCIDSDMDDDDSQAIFHANKLKPLKRSFAYPAQKNVKTETKHIFSLPPLIENVTEKERRIEIKSTKKSRIVPPRVRAKISQTCVMKTPSPDGPVAEDPASSSHSPLDNDANEPRQTLLIVKPPKYCSSPKSVKLRSSDSTKASLNFKKSSSRKDVTQQPPPIPPRPQKNPCTVSHRKDLTFLDYVNDPAVRMSPEGCQDLHSGNSPMTNMLRDAPPVWRDSFSPNLDDCYIEDEEDVKIVRPDNYDEYYDQDFISELEKYELPKSSVNMLVMQHFK